MSTAVIDGLRAVGASASPPPPPTTRK
jgi:hypothetical protein